MVYNWTPVAEKQGIAPGQQDDMRPTDGSLTVAKIAADLCPPHVSGGG